MNDKHKLTLSVINSELLQGDSTVNGEFDSAGGVIGSATGVTWQLTDRQGSVLPEHAVIEFTDDYFCLHDRHSAVFVNNSQTPVGYDRRMRLSHGDTLRIGVYHIAVYIGEMRNDPSLEYLTGQRQGDELDDFLASAGAKSYGQNTSSDPFSALMQQHSYNAVSPTPENISQRFIDLPVTAGDEQGFGFHSETLLQALAEGLGQSLPVIDEQQMYNTLREIGRMVRATLEGLLKLHSERALLADRQLRPIEDNPLRLDQDYSSTLALLFSGEKSPVHLSAPAAVSEILSSIRIHHNASQQAVNIALHSLLQAFSPDTLLERFRHYRRVDGEMTDDEAWYMYRQYFQELTSPRQQGFTRLFRQVYHQVYDRLVREQQDSQ